METIAIHVLIGREAAFFQRMPLAGDGISKNEKKANDDCVGKFPKHGVCGPCAIDSGLSTRKFPASGALSQSNSWQ
jgi:hypothetical protein